MPSDYQAILEDLNKEAYGCLIEKWNHEHKQKTKAKKEEIEREDNNEFSFDFFDVSANATKENSGLKPEHPLEVKVTQLIADYPQIATDMASVIETLEESARLQKKASANFQQILRRLPAHASPLSEHILNTYVVLKP